MTSAQRQTTRPIHPCVLNLTPEATASAAEFSCWLSPHHLVTACNTSVSIYLVSRHNKLRLRSTHVLQGSVIGLFAIHKSSCSTALLLIATATSRLSLIQLDDDDQPDLLPSLSIADLGDEAALEDMQVAVNNSIVACSWNGGDYLTVFEIITAEQSYIFSEPYTLEDFVTSHVLDLLLLAGLNGLEGAIVVVLHRHQETLWVTALTVSTAHQRTAELWTTPVAADSMRLQQAGTGVVLVVGVNEIQFLETSTGKACAGVLPVNGWGVGGAAPLIRLAVALDASRWAWVRDDTALVVLRCGQVYWLVRNEEEWVMLPTGYSLELCGEVASLSVQPLTTDSHGDDETTLRSLVLCGSRLGDSFLLELELKSTNIPAELVEARNRSQPKTIIQYGFDNNDEEEEPIRDWVYQEDQELYNLVSDDDDKSDAPKRRKTNTWLILHALTAVDRIVSLAPLGPICTGPTGFGRLLIPTGYGRSGGVALITRPGQDERCITAEHDVLHVESMSGTAKDFVCMSITGKGIQVLMRKDNEWEQKVSDFCNPTLCDGTGAFANALDVFRSKLLSSFVLANGQTVMMVRPVDTNLTCLVVTSVLVDGQIEVVLHHTLEHADSVEVVKLTEVVEQEGGSFAVGCLRSDGQCSYIFVDMMTRTITENPIPPANDAMEVKDVEDEEGIREFYANTTTATAIDVFRVSKTIFSKTQQTPSSRQDYQSEPSNGTNTNEAVEAIDDDMFDDFDRELYGIQKSQGNGNGKDCMIHSSVDDILTGDEALFVAVVRQSGDLEVHEISGKSHVLKWSARGLALGLRRLKQQDDPPRQPRSPPCVSVSEMSFFHCGSTQEDESDLEPRFCLALLTSIGDISLYKYSIGSDGPSFHRHRLHSVARTSKEQGRHHKKLIRKKIVTETPETFSYNIFRRFNGISKQRGLLALSARPFWIVSTMGYPVAVSHRLRHASPAGGKDSPMRGICTLADGSFFVVHERVGRVGSQRLTLFSRLFPSEKSSTAAPGGGFIVEKVPLGVTVRKVAYISPEETPPVSSGKGPQLYCLLVSQEEETDQSKLNSDGLTDEQRQTIQLEKETARIKKQVEADLGGFDVESEWVEEIERVDRLEVNTEMGGAPPLHQSIYSLWIVDAADSWRAVDSFQLEEYEHGIDLSVMSLSVFKSDIGTTEEEENLEKQQFIIVGTGVVNPDGEDVATKGRALLLKVKRAEGTATSTTPVADLTLAYEKNIFHGPVTTVSCLVSEGKNRLVIGAGSDVNIEQWDNEKLTQVGFYRAQMHVLDIQHFKSFMILADAYDSFYFLVWRESDKSLTLLAKDYDPIPVYAAGIMTRGNSLTFVCHDDRENLQFFQYAPRESAARGGNKLVCRADFHLGETTTSLSTYACQSSLLVHSATPNSTHAALKQQDPLFGRQDDDQRVGIYFGNAGGGLGAIVAINEPIYWRLLALQSVISNALESDAALSPRAWRHYVRSTRRFGCRNSDRKKGVIDGDLVLRFAELSIPEQEDLASAIGSTAELITDNLLEIQCASSVL